MSSNVSRIVPPVIAALPWTVMVLLTFMASFGAMVLYSAAGGNLQPWAANHIIRFGIFLVMALVISRFSENFFRKMSYPGYALICLMLLGVEALGQIGGGSQRWLDLGPIRLQPSELMKPAIVVVLAHFYASLPVGLTRSWAAIWPAGLLMGIPAALVLLQPDLGTTLAILAGGVTVMFLSGLPMRLFIGGIAVGAVAVPVAYFFALHDYQQRRVTTFLDPESDPLGAGYHITQSKIAIGSGGLFGKGFLNGSQSHLEYLPEGHTDFVFATMAEEWGFVGGLIVLISFFLLLRWGFRVSMRAKSRFGRLAAAGLTTSIFFYAAINLMMVMGLAPVVGIPLPFLSHGGSSMMTIMICVGLIMAIDRQAQTNHGTGSFLS